MSSGLQSKLVGVRGKVIAVTVLGLVTAAILVGSIGSWRQGQDAVLAAAPGAANDAKAASAKGGGPMLEGCPVFPADNVWNTRVDKLKVDSHSAAYVAKIGADKTLHPDFGTNPLNGIPITFIHYNQKRVKVTFEYSDESDLGNYPVPPDAKIEGETTEGSDRHIILVDTDRCELFELYNVNRQPDGSWKAGSGVQIDLTSNALRDDGKGSADAAGLAILPGLVRFDEVASGEIRHALRFTAPQTQRAYVWPARHYASPRTDPTFPPMGTRFRLKANVDISKFPKSNQVILTALKRYGMILADNGGPWFLTGVPDSRWIDEEMVRLMGIKGTDFEAVDESELPYIANSARVDPAWLGGRKSRYWFFQPVSTICALFCLASSSNCCLALCADWSPPAVGG